ncbi:MAG: hypothetical protein ABF868_07030 [Sporolactobacillus sp.]
MELISFERASLLLGGDDVVLQLILLSGMPVLVTPQWTCRLPVAYVYLWKFLLK